MDMSDMFTGKTRLAKETGRNLGGITTRLWIRLPINHVALLEQIRTHPSKPIFEDENDTMAWCIMKIARELGIETG